MYTTRSTPAPKLPTARCGCSPRLPRRSALLGRTQNELQDGYVEHQLAARHGLPDRARIAHVSLGELHLQPLLVR